MEGKMKQKHLRPDGILCWRSRYFVLDGKGRHLDVIDKFEDVGDFTDAYTSTQPCPTSSITRAPPVSRVDAINRSISGTDNGPRPKHPFEEPEDRQTCSPPKLRRRPRQQHQQQHQEQHQERQRTSMKVDRPPIPRRVAPGSVGIRYDRRQDDVVRRVVEDELRSLSGAFDSRCQEAGYEEECLGHGRVNAGVGVDAGRRDRGGGRSREEVCTREGPPRWRAKEGSDINLGEEAGMDKEASQGMCVGEASKRRGALRQPRRNRSSGEEEGEEENPSGMEEEEEEENPTGVEEEEEEENPSGVEDSVGSERHCVNKSIAQERSEEIAKASAATWEQFQHLLKRTRQSKELFDRTFGPPQEASTRATLATLGPCSESHQGAPALEALLDPNAASNGIQEQAGAGWTYRSRTHKRAGRHHGGSEDRVHSSPLNQSESDATARKPAKGDALMQVMSSSGSDESGSENILTSNRSRISGLTDAETRLMDTRDARDTRDEERSVSGESGASSRTDRKGPLSTSELGPTRLSATAAHRASGSTIVDSSSRTRGLEADLKAARGETIAVLERCARLERDGAASASEMERLRAEVVRVQAILREQEANATTARETIEQEMEEAHERQRETEREREASMAAAAAAAEAAANGMRARLEARLKDAEERRAEAEDGRTEAERVRDELQETLASESDERRRTQELLKASSRSESELHGRIAALTLGGDVKAQLTSTRSELEAVSRERDALAEELDQCIGRLGEQAREVATALRSRQEREIAEITARYEIEKEALQESVHIHVEADERAREDKKAALLAQEKELRAEAAKAQRREAQKREKQVRELKAEAEEATEDTRKDVGKLRKLHVKRVEKLESLLREERERLAEARTQLALCKANHAGDAGHFQLLAEKQRDESQEVLDELAKIQERVRSAEALEAEAREREGLAMSRLRSVMEEARLERAEGVEVRRQLREALAELEATRSTIVRKARTDAQLQRAVEIARNEVAMLEAERARWYEERRSMEEALERLSRLVHGPGLRGIITPAYNPKVSKRNTVEHPWKPAGGIQGQRAVAVAVAGGDRPRSSGDRKRVGEAEGGRHRGACRGVEMSRGSVGEAGDVEKSKLYHHASTLGNMRGQRRTR